MGTLSPEQLNSFRSRLRERREQLLEIIRAELLRSDEEQYADLAGRVHDPGEESVADLLHDLNLAIVDNQIRELRDVEAALSRLSMGTYGICEDCGGEINLDRLEAHATARRCITCQEKHERLFSAENKPSL